MKRAPKNLVLGCGTGYSAEQLRPFASTLRAAGYDGEVALVVYTDQLRALEAFGKQYGVDWISVPRYPQCLPAGLRRRLQNRGRMRMVHEFLQLALPPFLHNSWITEVTAMHLQHFYHIACGRYFIYYSWLRRHRHSVANVLLTDVRDVIFQGDPFTYDAEGALCCFLEPTVTLGDEPINTDWMMTTYGIETFQRHRGKGISCSGTTMGDVSSVLEYLRQMCAALIRVLTRITGLPGVDQAVHNCLIWDDRLPGARLFANGKHAVITLKNADAGTFVTDTEGRLLNDDGRPAPVLHQYDFHPDHVSAIIQGLHGNAVT